MTVRDTILASIVAALEPLVDSVEIEPGGDPDTFPSLAIFDGGHSVIEREAGATRREMSVLVEGYLEGPDGDPPTAERNALQAQVVTALLAPSLLTEAVELIEDGDLRMTTAILASRRRMSFAQDFTIQFLTRRDNPALPA